MTFNDIWQGLNTALLIQILQFNVKPVYELNQGA